MVYWRFDWTDRSYLVDYMQVDYFGLVGLDIVAAEKDVVADFQSQEVVHSFEDSFEVEGQSLSAFPPNRKNF